VTHPTAARGRKEIKAMIYKISVIVPGRPDVGGILNVETRPEPGETLQIGGETLDILEVVELMPPRGEFGFLHVECKLVEKSD
jgi:hypothetical protein